MDHNLLDLVRSALRVSIHTLGLVGTVQLVADVASEQQGGADQPPLVADHGRRIAELERRLGSA
jgi:hypothetical protein